MAESCVKTFGSGRRGSTGPTGEWGGSTAEYAEYAEYAEGESELMEPPRRDKRGAGYGPDLMAESCVERFGSGRRGSTGPTGVWGGSASEYAEWRPGAGLLTRLVSENSFSPCIALFWLVRACFELEKACGIDVSRIFNKADVRARATGNGSADRMNRQRRDARRETTAALCARTP
jgi:hypothetical protein